MAIDIEFISAVIGFLFTVMVFSYLIKDNFFFRSAVYIFIGAASGYAVAVVAHYIIIPKLIQPLLAFDLLVIFPLILSFLVLMKFSPRVAIGNLAMAFLVGVGAAAAIGGALVGTIVPQFQAATNAFAVTPAATGLGQVYGLLEAGVMLVGTVFTLASFHFSAGRAADGTPKRNSLIEGAAWVGRIFIAITLGVLFAGVYMAALTAMIERLSSILNFIRQLVGI